MATERLTDFPAKTTPVDADIFYLGDSEDSYLEKKVTLANILGNASHNDLNGLQGGTSDEYYHLTNQEHTDVTSITTAEYAQLANIGSTTISSSQWGYVGAMDQSVATTDSVTFDDAALTTGTVTTAPSTGNDIVNKTYADSLVTGGTVTSFSSGDLSPLFTTSVSDATTTPALSFSLSNAAANTFFGNFTGSPAAPGFGSPTLASANFANQGTTTTVLHGNAAGNPSWSAIDLANDVTGNLPVTNLNSGTSASSSTYWRGDGTWSTPPDTGVPSITGTANQVLVNGGSGTPVTSAATLTLPQDIATTSSPTFVGQTLTGLTQYSVPYIGAGGVIEQDNAGFYFDTNALYTKDFFNLDSTISINYGGSDGDALNGGFLILAPSGQTYFRLHDTDSSLLKMKASTGSELVLDINAGSTLQMDANLTVEATSLINQDLTTDSNPSFNSLTLTGASTTLTQTNAADVGHILNCNSDGSGTTDSAYIVLRDNSVDKLMLGYYQDIGAATINRYSGGVPLRIYSNTYLTSDSIKQYFGAGDDASLTYNGTNLVIKADEVGSGSIIFDSKSQFIGDTYAGMAKVYDDATGNKYGIEQLSAPQSGRGPETRLFTSNFTNAGVSIGKYTAATSFTKFIDCWYDGQIDFPLQTRFSAYTTTGASNVTGNGTTYTVVYTNEDFDVGSNFNSGTGVFTAPVDGTYHFMAMGTVSGFTAACTYIFCGLNKNSGTLYNGTTVTNPGTTASSPVTVEVNRILQLSASDTVSFFIEAGGEAGDTVDVDGGATQQPTFFSCIKVA